MRHLPSRLFSGLAFVVALHLVSCQDHSTNSDAPVPAADRTQLVVAYSIKKSESFKSSDSLTWSIHSQSGTASPPRTTDTLGTSRRFAADIRLKSPLGGDSLAVQFWSHGMRFLQARYLASGTTDTLSLASGSLLYDSLALALLRGMDSLHATLPQTREGLLNLYGTWILASDARAKGFPAKLPVGIPASQAIQATLVAASKTGRPLVEQAKTWSLAISTDSAKSVVLELLRSGKIAAKDSSSLFPPPPVRVSAPLAVGTGLRAGGTSVGLTGAFAWDEGLGLVVFQGFVTRDGHPDTNLVVYGLPVPKITDREAKLDGVASLLAKASAPEGTYVLTVTAQDGAQHKAISRDTFTVAAKLPDQPLAPRIRIASPIDKSEVPFETGEVLTTWIASTPQGTLSSVKVDGAAADKVNDSTWQAKVRLEPTGKARTIVAKVTNSAGLEAVATLELTRQADQTGPQVTWIAPTSDLEVENGVTSLTVRIKATDPSGIDTILIAGAKPDSLTAAGEYVRKVPLTVVGSPQAIVVRVVDSAGNGTASSKSITRANPATDVPPKTVLLEPASKTGTVVPFETKSVTARWTITDPYGIDSSSVTINGKPAKAEPDGKWSAVVDLVAVTPTAILLSVKNKNGVSGGDVASVTRQADTARPGLSWVAGGRSVGFDSAEVAVGVKASDNDSLASVTISGLVASGNDGVFTARIKLEVGDNPVQVVAMDRTGNKDTLRATVHRYQKLSITRVSPSTPDTTVGAGIGSVALSWKVVGAKAVGVGDSVLTSVGGLYSWIAGVSGSAAKIVLWATDSAGKRDTSAVAVMVRAAPKPRHDLDSGHFVRYWKPLHLVSEGADSIQWSTDGKAWTRYKDSVRVDCDSCRILSRAWPGPSAVDSTGVFWIRKVKAVAAGGYHSMFLMQDGTVWAAGKNTEGRLGDGTKEMRATPVPVLQNGQPFTNVTSVYGGGSHSLYLRKDATLWGSGVYFGDPDSRSSVPIQIMENVASASTWYSIAAILIDGTAKVMGSNAYGELGLDDTLPHFQPTPLQWGAYQISGISSIAQGVASIAIYSARRGLIQVGYLDTLRRGLWVNYLKGFVGEIQSMKLGSTFGVPPIVLSTTGSMWQVSTPDASDSSSLSLLSENVKDFQVNERFLSILKTDHSVWVKSKNRSESLGVGVIDASVSDSMLVPIGLPHGAEQIASGYDFILTLLDDGEVRAWGDNEFGQLGIGNTFDQPKPVQVNF